MRVAVTGSHGFIGSAVVRRLTEQGHQVIRLVRGQPRADEIRWDPAAGLLEPADLVGLSAVVHLAGQGIAEHRWSDRQRSEILRSRVDGTRLLAAAMARADSRPAALLSASAVGYYGDRGDEVLTEASPSGSGFLADVCRQWEGATGAAADAGVRVVHLRFGVVLSASGGALKKQLLLFRLGLGGSIGGGRQYLSWISLHDTVGAVEFALNRGDLRGAVNVTAPQPTTNAAFAKALGRAVHRPAVLPIPAFALKMAMGADFAHALLLASQRVIPRRLEEAGYQFVHPDLDGALAAAIARQD